jgi:hypothetical protein
MTLPLQRSYTGVAVGDQTAAVGVLVPEDPVDHVGDGLELEGWTSRTWLPAAAVSKPRL